MHSLQMRKSIIAVLAVAFVVLTFGQAQAISVKFNLDSGDGSGGLPCGTHKMQVSGIGNVCDGGSLILPDNQNKSMRAYRSSGGTIYGPWKTEKFPASCDAGTGPGQPTPCEYTYMYAALAIHLFNGTTDPLDPDHRVQISSAGTFTDGTTVNVPHSANVTFRLRTSKGGTIYGPWMTRKFNSGNIQPDEQSDHPAGGCPDGDGSGIPDAAETSANHACDDDGDTSWDLEFATLNVHLFNEDVDLLAVGTHQVQISSWGTTGNGSSVHVPPHGNVTFRLKTVASGTIYGPWMTRKFNKGDIQPDEQSGLGDCGAGSSSNFTCDDDKDALWDLEFATLIVHLFNEDTELDDAGGVMYRVQISSYGTAKNGDPVHVPPHGNVTFRLYVKKSGTIYGPWMTRKFNKGDIQPDEQKYGPVEETWKTPLNKSDDDNGDGYWDLEFATLNVYLFNDETELANCLPPPTGMISWWPGDSHANDIQGSNDGSLSGSAGYTSPGKVGDAFTFPGGASDYVRVPDDASLEPSRVTVDAWVRATSPGSHRYIVGKGAKGCTAASYALYTGSGGGLRFYIYNGSTYKLSPNAGSGVWDGQWHHIAGTYDGSHVRLYVDGDEIGSGTPTNISIAYGLATNDDLLIGQFGGTCSLPFRGDVDEVEVFNRALGEAEIEAIYDAGDDGKCKGGGGGGGGAQHFVQISSHGSASSGQAIHVPPHGNVTFRLYTKKSGTIYGPWMTRRFWKGDVQIDEQADNGDGSNCGAGSSANHTCDDDEDMYWDLEYATLIVHLFNGITELDDLDGTQYRVQVSSYGSAPNGAHVHVPPHGNVTFRVYTKKSGTIYGPWMTRRFNKGDVQPDEQSGGGCGTAATSSGNATCDDDPDTDWDLEYATLNVHLFNGPTDLDDGVTVDGPVANVKYRVQISRWGTAANGGTVHVPAHGNVTFRLSTKLSGTIYGPWMTRRFNKGAIQPDEQGTGPNTPESSSSANHTLDNDGDTLWDLEYATVKYRFVNQGSCTGCQTQISRYGLVDNNKRAHFAPHGNVTKRAKTCNGYGAWKTAKYNKGAGTWTWDLSGAYTQP